MCPKIGFFTFRKGQKRRLLRQLRFRQQRGELFLCHRQMLRAASKSAAGHGLRRAALTRNHSRYALLIASSAAAVLTRSYAEEYRVSPVAIVQPPKQNCRNVTGVRRNAAKSIRSALEWLLKTLRALLRCGLLWLNFLPAVATSPVLALQSETLNAWWWGLFRSSVCNAGPTFIKFSQVIVLLYHSIRYYHFKSCHSFTVGGNETGSVPRLRL